MKYGKSTRLKKSVGRCSTSFGRRTALHSAAALALLTTTQPARAQIFTYNMNDVVANSSTSSAGTSVSGLTFSNFTTTVGGTANAGSRFSFVNWPLGATNGSDTFSGGLDTTKYDDFMITPANGVTLSLDHINFTIQRSGTGIRQFAARTNFDSFGANVAASTTAASVSIQPTNIFQITDANTSATPGQTLTFSGGGFTSITSASPIDIRLYGFNAEGTGGTFSLDDVAIFGSITGAATDQYWDTNGATAGIGGSGTWDNTTPNWNAVVTGDGALNPFATNAPAKFGGTAGNVTVGANVAPASGIQFLTDGYVIGGGSITLAGNNNIDVATGATATINSVIAGTAGLSKTSTGTLILTGTNTYTGGTSVTGSLKIFDDQNLGASGSTLTLSGGTLLAGGNLSIGRNVTINGASHIDTGAFNVTLNNPINGNAGLTKLGSGSLILNAADASGTYTGSMTITLGTVVVAAVDGSNSSGLGQGATSVGNGGTLLISGVALGNGNGNSAPLITLNNGASLVGSGTASYTRSGGPLIANGTSTSQNMVNLSTATAGSVFTLGASVRQSTAGSPDTFSTIEVGGLGRIVLQSGAVVSSTTFAGAWSINSGILQVGPILVASTAPINAPRFQDIRRNGQSGAGKPGDNQHRGHAGGRHQPCQRRHHRRNIDSLTADVCRWIGRGDRGQHQFRRSGYQQ